MPAFNRVAILGLGLIGSSLARALLEKKLAVHIVAYAPSADTIRYALKHGFIHSGAKSAADAVKDADLIVFCAPPDTFAATAQEIAGSIKPGTIVTDVGSVKRQAVNAIKPHLLEHVFYVPAHPIAGSERTGVTAGNAALFNGKRVVLSPEEAELMSEPVKHMQSMWEAIGAKVEFMPAEIHDLIYAYVSHLPQLVAFAIAPFMDISARDDNYRRFTRLTKSDPALWVSICLANADFISKALHDFIIFLTQIHGELLENKQGSNEHEGDVPLLFASLVSTCLIATASQLEEMIGENPARYAGTGFADMTVMASNDPQQLLTDISAASTKITPGLEKVLARLREIKESLDSKNGRKLTDLFSITVSA